MSQQYYGVAERSTTIQAPLAAQDKKGDGERLSAIYESYARRYPNPRLQEEYEQRDQLLASHAAAQPKRGFFTSLFGARRRRSNETQFREEDVIEYYHDNNSNSKGQNSVDHDCIPYEAHCAASFHLASDRDRVVRSSPLRGVEQPEGAMIVTDLGTIVEFVGAEPQLKFTSDQTELVAYKESSEDTFHLKYVRATMAGPNFLAISWGFLDGIVVLYRRMLMEDVPDVGWERVAIFSPTEAVLSNLAQQGVHDDTCLLRVTDIVSLVVEYREHEEISLPPAAATLVVARLGGYMEMVPIPIMLWYGPILTAENHSRPKKKRKRQQKNGHYAENDVFNLFDRPNVAVLSAWQQHGGIYCLDAFRTSIEGDADWDEKAFPDSPPSEYVLAASGTKHDGRASVSFWTITTIFEEAGQPDEFTVEVRFRHNLDLGSTGPLPSVFVTPKMMQHWRKPRKVKLRQRIEDDQIETAAKNNTEPPEYIQPDEGVISTLSTSAPVSMLRFSLDRSAFLFLATMDSNGGVTIVECTKLLHLATHVQPGDSEKTKSSRDNMVRITCTRKQVRKLLRLRSPVQSQLFDIGWCWQGTKENGELCLVTMCTRHELQVTKLSHFRQNNNSGEITTSGAAAGVLLKVNLLGDEEEPASRVTLSARHSSIQMLPFVVFRMENEFTQSMTFCSLSSVISPISVIQSLVEAGRYDNAIGVATELGVQHDENAVKVLDTCHKELWSQTKDISHLRCINDNEFVVHVALSFEDDSTFSDLELLRQILHEAISRMARETNDDSLSTRNEEDLVRLQSLSIRMGTYMMLCGFVGVDPTVQAFFNGFADASLVDMAMACAEKDDPIVLTLLLIRHPEELLNIRLDILLSIPLQSQALSYAHLLPVISTDNNMYFLSNAENSSFLPWSQIPETFEKEQNLNPFVDSKDEELVRSKLSGINLDIAAANSREKLASWYFRAALHFYSLSGQLQTVLLWCNLGIRRLECDDAVCNGTQGGASDFGPTNVKYFQQLQALKAAASLLEELVYEGVDVSTSTSDSLFLLISEECEPKKSVEFQSLFEEILGLDTSASTVLSRYRKYAQLIASLCRGNLPEGAITDTCVSNYCQVRLQNALTPFSPGHDCERMSSRMTIDAKASLRAALSVCKAVATASAAPMRREDRVIKDPSVLAGMVLKIIYEMPGLDHRRLGRVECRDILDALWTLYESTPIPTNSASAHIDNSQLCLNAAFRHLMIADLWERWHHGGVFSILGKLRESEHKEQTKENCSIETNEERAILSTYSVLGNGILMEMCEGFSEVVELSLQNDGGTAHEESIVRQFISDVTTLNEKCFHSKLAMKKAFVTLVQELLRQERYRLLGILISLIDKNLVTRSRIQKIVIAFFRETIFLRQHKSDLRSEIQSLIRCQQVLGPVLPRLESEFKSIQRYLDASNFMHVVLRLDEKSAAPNPLDFQDQSPLRFLEALLLAKPDVMLMDCPDWGDEEFAASANALINRSRESGAETGNGLKVAHNTPPLPGGHVLHLGSILGLVSLGDFVMAKVLMIHLCTLFHYFGAAAAICFNLIQDLERTQKDDQHESERAEVHKLILRAVTPVLKEELYYDSDAKSTLFWSLLNGCQGSMMSWDIVADFSGLVKQCDCQIPREDMSTDVDEGTTVHTRVEGSNKKQSDFLVFKAANLVARGARGIVGSNKRANDGSNSADESRATVHAQGPGLPPREKVRPHLTAETIQFQGGHVGKFNAQSQAEEERRLSYCQTVLCQCVDCCTPLPSEADGNSTVPIDMRNIDSTIQVAMSILMELDDASAGIRLLEGVLGDLEKRVAAVLERASLVGSEAYVVPDGNLVRLLMNRGYSEQGSRRAVTMTNNEGFQDALSWATAHSGDRDFNDPIITLKTPNFPYSLDQQLVQRTRNALQLTLRFLKKDASISLVNTEKQDFQEETAQPKEVPKHEKQNGGILLNENGSAPLGNTSPVSQAPPLRSLDSPAKTPSKQPAPPPLKTSVPRPPPARHPHMTPQSNGTRSSTVRKLPSQPHQRAASENVLLELRRSIASPRPPTSRDERISLKKQGQLARSKGVHESKHLELSERKRLALMGREFLQTARLVRESPAAPANGRDASDAKEGTPDLQLSRGTTRQTQECLSPADTHQGIQNITDTSTSPEELDDGWDFDDF